MRIVVGLACFLGAATSVFAGGHTWRVNEIFSNSDGTVQFIEVKEVMGGAGETGTAGHNVTSNANSFTITSNVSAPTSFRHILLATPAFAALPGAPTPDYIFPPGSVPFFSNAGDTIRYVPFCTYTFGAGVLPTDGVNSLTLTSHEGHAFTIGPNSPTNYANQTGSVVAGCADGDSDGYGDPGDDSCPNGPETDCDDDNPDVNPGETEICYDGLDNDCNGALDCADAVCEGDNKCPAISAPLAILLVFSVLICGGFLFRRLNSENPQPTQ